MSNIKINGTTPTVIKRNGSNITKMYYNGTAFNLSQTANYNWYYNTDKTLVVREKISDGSFRWYFNYYTVVNGSSPWDSVPSNLQRFIMNKVLTYCQKPGASFMNQIGWWDNTIRLWTASKRTNDFGTICGIVESTYTGEDNPFKWETPTFDPING